MALVTLATFSSRIEAEIARGKLKAHGIDSHISADDAGGAVPSPMAYSYGARLMVHEEDMEKATSVLNTDENEE